MMWMYAVCSLVLFVCLPCFLYYKQHLRYRLAAAYKVLGTLGAASLALIAALRLEPHCWICFAALLIHAVADYLLEFNFFSSLFPVTLVHLIAVLCLLGMTAYLFWRGHAPMGKRMPLFIVYGVVLAVSCGFAIAGLTAHTLQGQLIAAGGALFFISDAMLLARLLFTASSSVDWVIMITYYAAQLLFGISCLV